MSTKLSFFVYLFNASLWVALGFFCWSFVTDIREANSKLDKIADDLKKYDSLDIDLKLDSNELRLISTALREKNVIVSTTSKMQKEMRDESGFKGIMFAHSGINASMLDWINFTTTLNEKLLDGYYISTTVGLKDPIAFILEDLENQNTTINSLRDNGTANHIFFIAKNEYTENAYTLGLYDIKKKVLSISNLAMAWTESQLSWLTNNNRNITRIPNNPHYLYLFNLNRFIRDQSIKSSLLANSDTLSVNFIDAEVVISPSISDDLKRKKFASTLDSLQTVKKDDLYRVVDLFMLTRYQPVAESGLININVQ